MENIEDRLVDYALGNLSKEEKQHIEKEAEQDSSLKQRLLDYQKLWYEMGELKEKTPPQSQTVRFERWLNDEIYQQAKPEARTISIPLNFIKYAAAAVVLLFAGLFIGTQIGKETTPVKLVDNQSEAQERFIQLVNNQSTTSRIKTINESTEQETLDPEVRDVLIALMKEDPSTQVRLTAVDALSSYSEEALIKTNMILALKSEEEPIVQIALIHALVHMGDLNAKESFQDIIDDEFIDESVKDEARLGITRL